MMTGGNQMTNYSHHRERVDKCLEEIQDKGVVDRVWEKVSGISVEDLTAENVTDSVGEIDLEKIPDDKEDEFNDCVYGSE